MTEWLRTRDITACETGVNGQMDNGGRTEIIMPLTPIAAEA